MLGEGEVGEGVDHGAFLGEELGVSVYLVGGGGCRGGVPRTGPRPASSTPKTHSVLISAFKASGMSERWV